MFGWFNRSGEKASTSEPDDLDIHRQTLEALAKKRKIASLEVEKTLKQILEMETSKHGRH